MKESTYPVVPVGDYYSNQVNRRYGINGNIWERKETTGTPGTFPKISVAVQWGGRQAQMFSSKIEVK